MGDIGAMARRDGPRTNIVRLFSRPAVVDLSGAAAVGLKISRWVPEVVEVVAVSSFGRSQLAAAFLLAGPVAGFAVGCGS
jgi:hypothetical protein